MGWWCGAYYEALVNRVTGTARTSRVVVAVVVAEQSWWDGDGDGDGMTVDFDVKTCEPTRNSESRRVEQRCGARVDSVEVQVEVEANQSTWLCKAGLSQAHASISLSLALREPICTHTCSYPDKLQPRHFIPCT